MLTELQLVQRFAAARDAGDTATCAVCWEELLTRNFDRIRGMVKGHVFAGGARLRSDRVDAALSRALERVWRFGERFHGTSIGELRNGVEQEVWNACMDEGRRELRHDKRYAGSFDEPAADPDGRADGSPYDAALARHLEENERERLEREELGEELGKQRELVEWAISQIENEGYRVVLHHTYIEPLDGDALAEKLGISRDNVYKRRERAKLQLEAILRDLPRTDPE